MGIKFGRIALCGLFLSGCVGQAPGGIGGGPGSGADAAPAVPQVILYGELKDVMTNAPVLGAAVSAGATATATMTGARYEVTVDQQTLLEMKASMTGYADTYSAELLTEAADNQLTTMFIVSDAVKQNLYPAGTTDDPTLGTVHIDLQSVNGLATLDGLPLANVSLLQNGAPVGTVYFINNQGLADPNQTTAIQYGQKTRAVVINVPPGPFEVNVLEQGVPTPQSAKGNAFANAVTLIESANAAGELPLTYDAQIGAILTGQDCGGCHSGNGTFRLTYSELTTRNLLTPADSNAPLLQSGLGIGHPPTNWTATTPDYLKVLEWVEAGAPEN